MKLQITSKSINLQLIIFVLIIVVFVAAVLLAFANAQGTAKDKQRLADMGQISAALKVYFDESGVYPTTAKARPAGIESYMDFWPVAPKADGSCSPEQNTYNYLRQGGGLDYKVTFCLGLKSGNFSAGPHTLTNRGIQ